MTMTREDRAAKLLATSGKILSSTKLTTYITDWNLTPAEIRQLTGHFLRNWTESELVDKLFTAQESGVMKVRLWQVDYIPVFQGDELSWRRLCYMAVRGKIDPVTENKKYWISFRSGVVDGETFSYAIIQEDKKS